MVITYSKNKHKIYNFADGDNDIDDIEDRQLGFVYLNKMKL